MIPFQNLVANWFGRGYTYTLTTYALKYLIEAEGLFGQRTTEYIYAGVEFNPSGPPRIWYPYNKYVVIQLNQSTISNLTQGIFQVSHEVIHVLSPNGQSTTTNLEEGLATYFSKIVTDRDSGDPTYSTISLASSKYLKPLTLISKLLEQRPDAIQQLRKIQPVIGKITKDDFAKADIALPTELVEELVKQMEY